MKHLKSVLKYLIPLLLAIVLITIIINKVDVPKLIQRVSSADIKWVSLAIFISILSHLSRAYRWNILLQPLGYYPTIKTTFAAVMVGYFGNIFLPRGGEVMRCLVLTKVNKIPFNASFGTVVAERAFDFICLLILIGFSLILEFDRFSTFFYNILLKKKGIETTNYTLLLVLTGIIFLIILFVFYIYRSKVYNSTIFKKTQQFLLGIWKGIISVKNSDRKGAFLLHTVFIWLAYFLMTYIMFFALPATEKLGLIAGLVILIVGGLGMSAPVSGGIGPSHIMVAGALHLFYQISQEEGIAYAFVIHTSQLISIIIIGGLSSIWVLIFQRKNKIEHHVEG